MAQIQHEDANRLLEVIRRHGDRQPLLTYQTAAVALGRPETDARPVAQMCDLLDAAAALADVPALALVKVRSKGGAINEKAWRGEHPRDAIINRSLGHTFTDQDFSDIAEALRQLHGMGNVAAWAEVRRRFGSDEFYLRLTGSPAPDALRRSDSNLPNEILDERIFEGAKKVITVNVYERDTRARRKCIAHWGCACVVCGFEFAAKYGELGAGFIHVHHLKPLGEIGQQYELNPITDLRPVCPNCHAMLHAGERTLAIEELQEIMSHVRQSRRD
jgi:hypothetical protein